LLIGRLTSPAGSKAVGKCGDLCSQSRDREWYSIDSPPDRDTRGVSWYSFSPGRRAKKLFVERRTAGSPPCRRIFCRCSDRGILQTESPILPQRDLDLHRCSGERPMKSSVVKRSIVVAGHKTSVSLEDAFWSGLKEIAGGRRLTLSDLVAAIDGERRHGNLSSAIRLYVLGHYRGQGPGIRAGAEASAGDAAAHKSGSEAASARL
jgi:predicted DNA-binding ribbon-helix-helix protein